jgi:hypothetical protein
MIDEVGVRDEGGLTGEEEGWEGGSGQHNFSSFTGFRIRQSAEIKMTISNEDRKKRDTRRSGTEQRKSLGVMRSITQPLKRIPKHPLYLYCK